MPSASLAIPCCQAWLQNLLDTESASTGERVQSSRAADGSSWCGRFDREEQPGRADQMGEIEVTPRLRPTAEHGAAAATPSVSTWTGTMGAQEVFSRLYSETDME